MRYFVKEVKQKEDLSKTAGFKARDDVESILDSMNIKKLPIIFDDTNREHLSGFNKFKMHIDLKTEWNKSLEHLKAGDTLIVQFPIVEHSLFMSSVFKKLKKRHVNVVLLVHDLELLRWGKRKDQPLKAKLRTKIEETSILNSADHIIVHNNKMHEFLKDFGIEESKLVNLEIFDYLNEGLDVESNQRKYKKDKPVIIAGNLRKYKSGYAYDLPDNQEFNLYGIEYTAKEKENVHYFGSFPPNELPTVLDGGYGLVWDGPSSNTCTGTYGEYLRINNPHKTSLYLSIGLPVVIWKEAALASFIEENKCGITVNSLDEIHEVVSSMSEDEYNEILENTKKMSSRLLSGYYTQKAINECIDK